MTCIVATNVVAGRPPERRLTETPHAHAKNANVQSNSTSLCMLALRWAQLHRDSHYSMTFEYLSRQFLQKFVEKFS